MMSHSRQSDMTSARRLKKDRTHELVLQAKKRVLDVIDSIPPQDLVYAIKDAPSLRGMILGYVAEYQFLQYLKNLGRFSDLSQPDDHDRTQNKADILISYTGIRISFQLKSIQTNSIAYLTGDELLIADVQNDASDKRTITLPNGHNVETTNYKVGDYDILAVPLFPFSGEWNFAYMLNSECRRTDSKKYNEEDKQFLLKTTERITYPLSSPWTNSLDEIILRACKHKKAKNP